MVEMIKTNIQVIVALIFVFLMGIGIGAAITDMINREKKDEEG